MEACKRAGRLPKKGLAAIEKHAIVSENVWPDVPDCEMLKQMMSFRIVRMYRHTLTSAIGAEDSAVTGISSSRSSSRMTRTLVHNHDADNGETHIAAANSPRWKSTMVLSGSIGICGMLHALPAPGPCARGKRGSKGGAQNSPGPFLSAVLHGSCMC